MNASPDAKKACTIALAATLAVTLGAAAAHENFRIVGTIVKVQATQVDVKAADGQLYEIDIDDKTIVTRDKQKVAASEMQPGRDVVVVAVGHDMFDLVAVDVQLSSRPAH